MPLHTITANIAMKTPGVSDDIAGIAELQLDLNTFNDLSRFNKVVGVLVYLIFEQIPRIFGRYIEKGNK